MDYLPEDLEAERAVLAISLLAGCPKDVTPMDFNHHTDGFNGWLFARIRGSQKKKNMARLINKEAKRLAKKRGERHLASAIALLVYRRDGEPRGYLLRDVDRYVGRLKAARKYRDRQLLLESQMHRIAEAWRHYEERLPRPVT